MIAIGNCHFDPETGHLRDNGGARLELRPQAIDVLRVLAAAHGEVVGKNALMDAVWPDTTVTEDSLYQCIADIRRVLPEDARELLQTVPRRGYRLAVGGATGASQKLGAPQRGWPAGRHSLMAAGAVLALVLTGWLSFGLNRSGSGLDESGIVADQAASRENLTVLVQAGGESRNGAENRLAKSVVTALSRYSDIEPVEFNGSDNVEQGTPPDYRLELSLLDDDGSAVNAQLFHQATNELVVAEHFDRDETTGSQSEVSLGARVAGLLGSPAGGAIGRHLMEISHKKPVEELTRPECLAHGYGCAACSGELSNITPRALQCLANLLEEDPQDPDAWALQATVYTRQYLYGDALPEPMYSDKSKRGHLATKALEAAARAEGLSDGTNQSVYWGLVQAYLTTCDAEKMQLTVDRGLQLNPDDPTLQAVFGTYLVYLGKWKEGRALLEKALRAEPKLFKDWWYMALGHSYYGEGEYQQAYEFYLKAYSERNWISHLELAYTLPHLGRVFEGRLARDAFMRQAPAMTRENAYELFQSYCFDNDFLARMEVAFDLIDMPSRGSGDDFEDVRPIRAKVEQIGGRPMEYIDVGEGTPLVLIHGSIADYRVWGYNILPLSETYRVLAPTRRFFGKLDWPVGNQRFDFNVDAQEMAAFIEAMELGPVYVAGWSSSSEVVSALARARPDLLRGLIIYEPVIPVLVDPNKNPNAPSPDEDLNLSRVVALLAAEDDEGAIMAMYETVAELGKGEFETEPPMLQRVILDNARTLASDLGLDPISGRDQNALVVNCDFIKGITVPGLIVYGETTNRPWQYMSERYADCLPDGEVAVVKGANHKGPISHPQQVADYFDAFIQKTEAAR